MVTRETVSLQKVTSINACIVFLVLLLSMLGYTYSSAADAPPLKSQAMLYASFDRSIIVDKTSGITIEANGGKIISDGLSGGALSLGKGEHIALKIDSLIKSTEGSISLWIRPHWDYYTNTNGELLSHTFMSFTWNDEKQGYFTLSDGWWEPAGSFFTYFIINNAEKVHTKVKHPYVQNEWTHMACTWKSGPSGYLKLYINGVLVGKNSLSFDQEYSSKGKLYIGSDKGAALSRNRWADCDVDELAIYSRALSDAEIEHIRKSEDPFWETRRFSYLKFNRDEPIPSQEGGGREIRAIFEEGNGWMTAAGAERTIKRIKEAGFNVFIPCVWHGMGTRYPSIIAPGERFFPPSEADPLARLIAIAHQNGIEVFPWFTVALRQREFLKEYYDSVTPEKAFDLHRPEFRKFITDVMLDVVRRYDIDGINLDYIRTKGICKCSYCIKEYKRVNNRELLSDISQRSPRNDLNQYYQQWQDNAVEDIVRRVAEEGRRIKKGLLISVDGNPIPNFMPSSHEGRQEVKWANAGLVDIIFCMDYEKRPDFEVFEIIRKELKEPEKLMFLLGNYEKDPQGGLASMHPGLLSGNIEYARTRWPGGIGVYIYQLLSDAQVKELSSGPFRTRKNSPTQRPLDLNFNNKQN